jgi:uncharacterized protein (DUF427 family)
MGNLPQFRYEPIDKRIRAVLGEDTVLDTRRAMLVWEPKRLVASYAVPISDIEHALRSPNPAAGVADSTPVTVPTLGDRPVYDPRVPFSVHSAEGTTMDIRIAGTERPGAAFLPHDETLEGFVILDFTAFDAWYEEDERNVSHPRDPYHRIEVLHSSRRVRVELDGTLLAESSRPYLLFEAPLPVRYYLPAEDVADGMLRPSPTRTFCAYKGQASYLSAPSEEDIAWSYREPLREATEVKDRIAFFNERVELTVDGERVGRPVTPWSRG